MSTEVFEILSGFATEISSLGASASVVFADVIFRAGFSPATG
jgi:hypothetical protein